MVGVSAIYICPPHVSVPKFQIIITWPNENYVSLQASQSTRLWRFCRFLTQHLGIWHNNQGTTRRAQNRFAHSFLVFGQLVIQAECRTTKFVLGLTLLSTFFVFAVCRFCLPALLSWVASLSLNDHISTWKSAWPKLLIACQTASCRRDTLPTFPTVYGDNYWWQSSYITALRVYYFRRWIGCWPKALLDNLRVVSFPKANIRSYLRMQQKQVLDLWSVMPSRSFPPRYGWTIRIETAVA